MLTLIAILTGCYNENIPQVDVVGKLVVPEEAATREVPTFDENGEITGSETVTDPRLIGPVFLGAFSAIDQESFAYPHPAMGPIISPDYPGDTFPYGGTTVGRFDFACYEALACKVVTGRFTSYGDVLDYFKNVLGKPVTDSHGDEVMYGDTFQQECYRLFHATSDEEFAFIGPQDFTQNADGDFEAEFLMAHTTLVPGMALWGYMDAPTISTENAALNGTFDTCDDNLGNQRYDYDQTYFEGQPYPDILNYPSLYLRAGDWVADGTTTVQTADDQPVITLSIPVTE